MKNKTFIFILALMITTTLIFGCGSKPEPVVSESVEVQEPEEPEIPEPEPIAEPEPEPIAEPEPEPVQEEVEPDLGYEIISIDEVQMYVTTNANIRSGPSTDYDIVGGLTYAQEITVNGKVETADSTWYVIKTDDNTTQMVSSSLLSTTKPQPPQQQKPSGGSTSSGNGNGGGSSSSNGDNGGIIVDGGGAPAHEIDTSFDWGAGPDLGGLH